LHLLYLLSFNSLFFLSKNKKKEEKSGFWYVGEVFIFYRRILMSRIAAGSALAALIALASMTTGCNQDQSDQHHYSYNKQSKSQDTAPQTRPVVAIVPLINSTKTDIPWNLSDELTYTVYHRLANKDKLYLVNLQKVTDTLKKLQTANPFVPDITWIKHAFPDDEFVVFMELIEHEETLQKTKNPLPATSLAADLNVTVRLRVIDVRSNTPSVVLQEMIHDSHHIPKQFTSANFYQIPWGQDSYDISPLGLAHAELAGHIASRLEDYVLLAKNR
jgi:hypothetical protein